MKYRQNLLLSLCLISGFNTLMAQHWMLGGTANIGFSKIISDYPASWQIGEEYVLSGNWGLCLEKKINGKSSLGVEAIWMLIGGQYSRRDEKITNANGELIGLILSNTIVRLNYIGVPLYYRMGLGKFGIKAGIQPMVYLFGSSKRDAFDGFRSPPYITISKLKHLKYDRFDFGPKIGFDYQFNSRLRIRADYYYGLNKISSDNAAPFEKSNRQLSVGLNYIFWVSQEK